MNRDQILAQIRQFEGYAPKSSWDYAQHSNGYGTRAQYPGEAIDQPEAERRLQAEVDRAAASVDAFAPGLDPGTRAALVSLTYNAGPGWQGSGLGEAIRSGDLASARNLFLTYNKAGGTENAGLVNRRAAEANFPGAFGGNPKVATPSQPEAVQGPLLAQAPIAQPNAETPPTPFGMALPSLSDAITPQAEQPKPDRLPGSLSPDDVRDMVEEAQQSQGLQMPRPPQGNKRIQLASAQPMRLGFGGLR